VGSVRLHERWGEDRAAVLADIDRAFAAVPKVQAGARVVGIAGTWTTLATLALELSRYDSEQVHGHVLPVEAVEALAERLWRLTLPERLLLPGLQPGRADVIAVGALIAARSLRALGASEVVVSDRGVRWGLLYERLASEPI
jgi:exopolyphosphatase/guanosine-5'-triphosphate,3'-diphosphate pyrophosphatase